MFVHVWVRLLGFVRLLKQLIINDLEAIVELVPGLDDDAGLDEKCAFVLGNAGQENPNTTCLIDRLLSRRTTIPKPEYDADALREGEEGSRDAIPKVLVARSDN